MRPRSPFDDAFTHFELTSAGSRAGPSIGKADNFVEAFAPFRQRASVDDPGYLGALAQPGPERQRPGGGDPQEEEPTTEIEPSPQGPTFEVEPSAPPPVDTANELEERRRPGYTGELPDRIEQTNEGAFRAPPPEAFPEGAGSGVHRHRGSRGGVRSGH